jgi:hypothetical protein
MRAVLKAARKHIEVQEKQAAPEPLRNEQSANRFEIHLN